MNPSASISTNRTIIRALAIVFLRVALVALLFGAGWLTYKQLPVSNSEVVADNSGSNIQIILKTIPDIGVTRLDVPVDIYPVDIVAVRHEFFTEPRAGKRFEDFLKERMKGRSPINARLDQEGHGTVVLSPGNWWLHAKLSGDEEVEWRLPLTVTREKQTIELTPQNAYTRSRSF
ncbi:MAG TPA: hypothetical protein VLA93_02775 [Pyrinomonadaceae bacterium]|nr:hypothetical protein [Pyrinomonadaceae bacterium]